MLHVAAPIIRAGLGDLLDHFPPTGRGDSSVHHLDQRGLIFHRQGFNRSQRVSKSCGLSTHNRRQVIELTLPVQTMFEAWPRPRSTPVVPLRLGLKVCPVPENRAERGRKKRGGRAAFLNVEVLVAFGGFPRLLPGSGKLDKAGEAFFQSRPDGEWNSVSAVFRSFGAEPKSFASSPRFRIGSALLRAWPGIPYLDHLPV